MVGVAFFELLAKFFYFKYANSLFSQGLSVVGDPLAYTKFGLRALSTYSYNLDHLQQWHQIWCKNCTKFGVKLTLNLKSLHQSILKVATKRNLTQLKRILLIGSMQKGRIDIMKNSKSYTKL